MATQTACCNRHMCKRRRETTYNMLACKPMFMLHESASCSFCNRSVSTCWLLRAVSAWFPLALNVNADRTAACEAKARLACPERKLLCTRMTCLRALAFCPCFGALPCSSLQGWLALTKPTWPLVLSALANPARPGKGLTMHAAVASTFLCSAKEEMHTCGKGSNSLLCCLQGYRL